MAITFTSSAAAKFPMSKETRQVNKEALKPASVIGQAIEADIARQTPEALSAAISLDNLLTESMAEAKIKTQVRAAREVLSRGTASGEDAEALNRVVKEWEAKREWNPAAAVVMFTRQQCSGCGYYYVQFQGYFQRQTHKQQPGVQRWVPAEKPVDYRLPREAKYRDSIVEMCEDCAEAAGFEVEADDEGEE